jgi:hypothetical protein
MPSERANALRTIAEHELEACFGQLDPATKNDLATTLVRQWITNDGRAVIVTREHHFWFKMDSLEDGQTQVVRDVEAGTFVDHLRRSRVVEAEIPALLHELTLRQCVRCYTDYGQPLQLRVDPANKMFFVELVLDQED